MIGHINQDVILEVGDIPQFGSEEIRSFRTSLGGTGANIAIISSLLGVPVTLISRVSRNFPEKLLGQLRRENIELILERDEAEGPICYIVDSRQEQIAFMLQGPMNTPGAIREIKSRYCHFATSNPEWIVRQMDHCSGIIVFDPGQEIKYRWTGEMLERAISKSHMMVLNRKEREFLGERVDAFRGDLIVTMGKEGCSLNGEAIRSESTVQGKSTVGAGDAFRAGMYRSLYDGGDMRDACRSGNAAAAHYIRTGRSLDISNWSELRKDRNA